MDTAGGCRLMVVASHPIPYFTPVYRRLAAAPGLRLRVLYCRDAGVRPHYDKQFRRTIRWDTEQLSGYEYAFLRNVSPVHDTFNPLHAINPGALIEVWRGADAVWINGYLYPSNWLAVAGAALGGGRVLARSELWLDPARRARLADGLRDWLIRRWVRRSDALLYIGELNRRAYLAYGATEGQLFFSPYSVDVDGIATGAQAAAGRRPELRRKWGLPDEVPLILYVGKLTARKHPEAMLAVAERGGDVPLHVAFAGSGPEEALLRAAAARRGLRNVSFLGFVNQSALPEIYALADVFVLPSEQEPWGLVLNEAMAAGLPVVVADGVGAAADLVTHGRTGYAFTRRDWDGMAAHVLALAADAELRRCIGDAARERSRAYSFDATARGVLDALDALGVYTPPAQDGASRRVAAPTYARHS